MKAPITNDASCSPPSDGYSAFPDDDDKVTDATG
jgi:hypothetical protein